MSASVNSQTFENAQFLGRVQDLLTRSLSRLSSGERIVSPADDSQGVGLIEKLGAQDKRVQAASTNVQNAASYLQSVDGFIAAMNKMVTRMSELSVMASDGMKNSGDIALYREEFRQIQQQLRSTIGGTTAEIGGTADITKPLGTFNGIVLFGANPAGLPIASGASGETIVIPQNNLRDGAMLDVIQQDASGNFILDITDPTAIAKIKAAVQDLADERGSVGAVSRRFEIAGESLSKRDEDLQKSTSSIRDVDIATESTRLSKYQMISQAASMILAQATQSPKSVLKLLNS
ncbi:flagellin [Opitutaceae bacterium EW11]|nr:flagellin [Opitutaceae bacterium EW11]